MKAYSGAEEIFRPLLGNDDLKSFLTSAVGAGKLSHAYIIEGAKGSGRYTLATMLAASLEPSFAEKILSEGCVDVTVYSLPEDKKSIGIATVRELKYKAQLLPQELSCQVFIIRDAHSLTPEAQNSLLKILEEPPSGVYIFLLCDNSAALLPTVRSRAPSIRMQHFSEDELARLLPQINKKASDLSERAPEEFSLLLRSAGGTIGGAISKLTQRKDTKDALRQKAVELMGYLRDGKRTDALLFFSAQSFARDEMATLLGYIGDAARDMLAMKKADTPRMLFYLSRDDADEDAYNFTAEALISIYSVCDRMTEQLSFNPNMNVFSVKCACSLTEAAI